MFDSLFGISASAAFAMVAQRFDPVFLPIRFGIGNVTDPVHLEFPSGGACGLADGPSLILAPDAEELSGTVFLRDGGMDAELMAAFVAAEFHFLFATHSPSHVPRIVATTTSNIQISIIHGFISFLPPARAECHHPKHSQ